MKHLFPSSTRFFSFKSLNTNHYEEPGGGMKIRNKGNLRNAKQSDTVLTVTALSCPLSAPSSWSRWIPRPWLVTLSTSQRVCIISLLKTEKLSRPKGNKPLMGTRIAILGSGVLPRNAQVTLFFCLLVLFVCLFDHGYEIIGNTYTNAYVKLNCLQQKKMCFSKENIYVKIGSCDSLKLFLLSEVE